MNETESDAQASYIFFPRRRINSDNLHSATIIRCEQMREMRGTFFFLPTGMVPPWELVPYADCILCE